MYSATEPAPSQMAITRHRHRHRRCPLLSSATVAVLALLLLASFSALGSNPTPQFSKQSKNSCGGARKIKEDSVTRVPTRRRLGGLGSSPPTCRSKCGKCEPCRPAHVPVQTGLSTPLEYYPEAWRCKCGNDLFMP